jgi:hypothetical protein
VSHQRRPGQLPECGTWRAVITFYYWRFRLPAGIARATGRKEVCWSLQTADRPLARRLALALSSAAPDTIAPLAVTHVDGTNLYLEDAPDGLDRATLDRVLRHIYDRLVDNDDTRRAMDACTARFGQSFHEGSVDDGRGDLVESLDPSGTPRRKVVDRLGHLVLLTPSCGDPASTAKRSE